ncbi:MAG: hypothetical protein IH859_01670 [Chloroflexi bacterium]|nr:hypothetical protein [Chloroflexota bacterium]
MAHGWDPVHLMAIEDFTTYTEVDTSSRLTVTASKITGVNVDRDITAYVYDDKGVDNFNGLNIEFEIQVESASQAASWGGCGLTVSVVDSNVNWLNTDVFVRLRETSGSVFTLSLLRGDFDAEDNFTAASGTTYYCILLRTAGSDTITLEIYSDSSRTTLLDTLSVSGYGTGTKYRYLYGFANHDNGTSARDWDGFVQNMEVFAAGFVVSPPALAIAAVLSTPTGIDTSKPPALAAPLSLPLAVSILTAKPAVLSAALAANIPIPVITYVTRLKARLRDIRLIAVKRDTGLNAGHRDIQIIVRSKRT